MTGSDCATLGRNLSVASAVALLAFLSACSDPATKNSIAEAKFYAAHARGNYKPPGPPEDPWGPYVREASAKYDVPEIWIRSVMRQESGGSLYLNGGLVTSRSEEHTSELQSHVNLVCRLLLEKKKKTK